MLSYVLLHFNFHHFTLGFWLLLFFFLFLLTVSKAFQGGVYVPSVPLAELIDHSSICMSWQPCHHSCTEKFGLYNVVIRTIHLGVHQDWQAWIWSVVWLYLSAVLTTASRISKRVRENPALQDRLPLGNCLLIASSTVIFKMETCESWLSCCQYSKTKQWNKIETKKTNKLV